MPEAYPEFVKGKNLISTHRITEILKIVSKIFDNKKAELLGNVKKEKICLPKIRENKIVDIVQICSGCLGNCAYCGTKLAKGDLFSYSPEKIVKEIKLAKEHGCEEFWLTGQDLSCYGFDNNYTLPKLLEEILKKVNEKYFIRMGMMNPSHLNKIINPLLEMCEDERILKFFHIPVQSGSDKVLKEMNRKYCAEDFKQIVKKIRNKFPLATIWTDLIVGYPTETEEDFNKSLDLIKSIKPDWTHVSKFGVRKKTKAADLKQLKSETIQSRSIEAGNLAKRIAIEQNKKWLGWGGEVLVDDVLKARNFVYKSIHLESGEIGSFVKIKINKVEGLKLFGSVV
ncbi:MAG: MiaB/RimO family radical SAM methylthiotransferase, partial [Candidatus Aenigmarchaeota archaeon]|nr:MiaB/RimO family radical SAM methylthiotransferase [Candidatus Aenigmarchaeota archaeon]